uniref:Uncharacterized protein n=1 Tax=Timema poppense TaxID=170557 RepID=A0A7R9CQE7_TIMPO|nr:unnamed protein product [Timema poppensis]
MHKGEVVYENKGRRGDLSFLKEDTLRRIYGPPSPNTSKLQKGWIQVFFRGKDGVPLTRRPGEVPPENSDGKILPNLRFHVVECLQVAE